MNRPRASSRRGGGYRIVEKKGRAPTTRTPNPTWKPRNIRTSPAGVTLHPQASPTVSDVSNDRSPPMYLRDPAEVDGKCQLNQ